MAPRMWRVWGGEAGVMMAEIGSGESEGEKIPQAVYENECSTSFNSDRLV